MKYSAFIKLYNHYQNVTKMKKRRIATKTVIQKLFIWHSIRVKIARMNRKPKISAYKRKLQEQSAKKIRGCDRLPIIRRKAGRLMTMGFSNAG